MNKTKLIFVLLASLVLGACSSSDDDSNSKDVVVTETEVIEAPAWQIDWNNNQERPNWTEPDGYLYEVGTVLKVQIEETLMPFASSGDLLALFVNGELRGLASPAVKIGTGQTENGKFLMKAYGKETGTVNMSLQYYNQQLKHLFTLTDDINLDADETTGIDEAFIPEFTLGSAKYPVVMNLNVSTIIAKASIQPAQGDYFAAFVGVQFCGTISFSGFSMAFGHTFYDILCTAVCH